MMNRNYQPIIRGQKKRPDNILEQFKQFCEEIQGVDARAELDKISNAGIIPNAQMQQIRGYAQKHAQDFGAPMRRR